MLTIILISLAIAFALSMRRAALGTYAALALAVWWIWSSDMLDGDSIWPSADAASLLMLLPVLALCALAVPSIRRSLLVVPAFGMVRKILPKVSDTEQQALDAGTIGFDAQLFSGTPDWEQLRAVPPITLTAEERAFMDGPTEQLCKMIDDWQIRHGEREVPEPIWDFRQKARLPGNVDFKSAWRSRFFRPGTVDDSRQSRLALARCLHDRHGAELVGPRRTH